MSRAQWGVALSVAGGWIACACWLWLEAQFAVRRARREAALEQARERVRTRVAQLKARRPGGNDAA